MTSLTPYVPIAFPPSQLGSPGIKTCHEEGLLDNLTWATLTLPPANKFFFAAQNHAWSRRLRYRVHHRAHSSAALLQPGRSFGNPQRRGEVWNTAAMAERRGLTWKAAPPLLGQTWKCHGKPLTSSLLASRPPTATPWPSLSPPPRSHTSGLPPGNIPPWRRNAGGNASTCLEER